MEWEQIDNLHQRLKVPGGWVLKAYEPINWGEHNVEYTASMCFIPDPNHEWKEG